MPKNLLGEQPFCAMFQRISGSEKVMKKRGGVLKVSVKCFLFLGAENFVGRTTLLCCVSENFWQRKSFEKEGKECQRFQSKTFCLTVPKNLVGEAFCAVFQKISGMEKVLKKRGKEYKNFQSKVFCLAVPNFLVGERAFCAVFQRISVAKFLKKRGKSIKSFRGKFFVSQCRKIW